MGPSTVRCFLLTWFGLFALCLASDETDIWPYNTFSTGPWQPPHLSISQTGDVQPGHIFVGIRNSETNGTAPTIYDNRGNLVYQGPQKPTMDFKVQRLFHQDVITFWSGENKTLGYGFGKVHILDSTYREIYTVTLQGDFITPSGETMESYIDVHEHIITPRNTMVVTAINLTQHDLSSIGGRRDHWMVTNQIYEIDIPTNEILFSWDALDHEDQIPLNESARPPGESGSTPDTAWDAYHMNSVATTNDGYLVSLRFYHSAFYLNSNGTVRWQLSGDGGGDFEGDVRFAWQHDIRVFHESSDGLVISLFNNAGTKAYPGPESSGMILGVDTRNMSMYTLQNVSDPNDLVRSNTQGSFQLLGPPPATHTFAGYGNVPKFKEYDADGNIVLSAEYGFQKQAQSYRAYKFPWVATPHWSPAVIATRTSDTTADVSLSWNGATEYDNWAIYSVPFANSTRTTLLGSYNRTGFETNVTLRHTNVTHIQAVACKGDTPLGASEVHQVLESRDLGFSFNPFKILTPLFYMSLLW